MLARPPSSLASPRAGIPILGRMSLPAPQAPTLRWINAWLTALPVAYILSPAAVIGLPFLRTLPPAARALLLLFVVSQLLPAVFAPTPLLALLLAALRILLMFGLIGIGHALQESGRLRLALPGLGLVYLTALVYSQWQGVDWLSGRLIHPYLTTTSLALTAAYGLWLCLFLPGRWAWRAPGALLALGALFASGSRGPLIAAVIGVMAGLMMGRKRRLWTGVTALAAGAVLVGVLVIGEKGQIATLERFRQLDLAGRQVIWHNTLDLIHDLPVGGVGAYRVGTALAPTSECYLFAALSDEAGCPTWIRLSGQPWLIAHNGVLHQWAETGPLGTLGLLSLLGASLFVAARRRDPLGFAVLSGVVVTNIIDNTWLVPGAVSGELFWIMVGTQLRHFSRTDLPGASLTGTGVLAIVGLPLLGIASSSPAPAPLRMALFSAAPTIPAGSPYRLLAQFQGQPGTYMVSLASCSLGCRSVRTAGVKVTEEGGTLVIPDLRLGTEAQQRMELRLYADQPLALRPLAVYRWQVNVTAPASTAAP